MMSFNKFVRSISLTVSRPDRRRSKLSGSQVAEILETRAVLTEVAIDPAAMFAAMMANCGTPTTTTVTPTTTAPTTTTTTMTTTSGVTPTAAPAPTSTPTITSITSTVNSMGALDLTVTIGGYTTNLTLELSGAAAGSYNMTNNTNVINWMGTGSGTVTARLKDASGNYVGSSYSFTLP